MTTIYLASVTPFSGKSLLALALGLRLKEQGCEVGYFRPLGAPAAELQAAADEDARFIAQRLGVEASPELLCPVLLTQELEERALAGNGDGIGLSGRIKSAFAQISEGKDVLLAGGIGDLARGSLLELSAPKVAELLNAKVILLAKYDSPSALEQVLLGARLLGERLRGVIFNFVPEKHQETVRGPITRYLEGHGIPVLGAIPEDPLLGSVSIQEVADGLPARALCCENKLDQLVGNLVIGAMSVTGAIKYFREKSNKLVITGGDRPDIQLAALQTSTKAILLTGNLHPSPPLLHRAQQLGVPFLLTAKDTLSAVAAIEQLRGHVRTEEKIKRAQELVKRNVDLDRVMRLVGL